MNSHIKTILVQACLNGSRQRRDHERVPITASELARDAREVVREGAAALHFHPRLPDGRETLDERSCGKAILAVREAVRIPLGISTASWIESNPPRKVSAIQSWSVSPDFASVNFNEEGWKDVCRALVKKGIWIEAGLSSVSDVRRFIESEVKQRCIRVLVEINEKRASRAVSLANEMDEALRRARVRIPVLHHGCGRTTWKVLENALSLNRDIRVGLEDTLHLADGRLAKDNAELVAAAVKMVRMSSIQGVADASRK